VVATLQNHWPLVLVAAAAALIIVGRIIRTLKFIAFAGFALLVVGAVLEIYLRHR